MLWPIIEPLTGEAEPEVYSKFKEEIWSLFFSTLQSNKQQTEINTQIKKKYPTIADANASEFIISLINDFSLTFYEELVLEKNTDVIMEGIQTLIDQQVIMSWIAQLVEQTFTPLLAFKLNSLGKLEEVKQVITRILIALVQEEINSVEAENQITIIFQNYYNLADELIIFIKSIVKTIGQYREKYGLEELARLAEKSISKIGSSLQKSIEKRTIIKSMKDPIYERENVVNEWMKNILGPATIGLRIAGKDKYNGFMESTRKNFELFLDQALSADDFEKRLQNDLTSFGGDDEELILPIRESISNSVRFLEIARIDDPSLSLLLMLIEEEKEGTKRNCL
ncbi:MAG: hypothetical protein FK734_13380 [Asgard group archaeon]|nr:hypothetical protein [Asgard group archaeon]